MTNIIKVNSSSNSNIELPFGDSPVIEIFLTNNVYVYADKDIIDGSKYTLIFIQDGTGGRTVTFGVNMPSGLVIDTNSNAISVVNLQCSKGLLYIDSMYPGSVPKIGITFSPTTGILLNNSNVTVYNTYTQTGELTLTVTNEIIGGTAILSIVVDGNTITVTGATKDPKSDDASTTSGDTDRYVFWKDTLGVYYSITNLGQ
jgi:hypothetical protein